MTTKKCTVQTTVQTVVDVGLNYLYADLMIDLNVIFVMLYGRSSS